MGQDLFDPEQTVTAIYKALLGRNPDPGGLKLYSDELRRGLSLNDLLSNFLRSKEFLHRFTLASSQSFPLDSAPRMTIQTSLSEAEHRSLWEHVAEVWSSYGRTDPFWSVLTDEHWRSHNMTDDQILSSFYETGESEGQRLDAWLQRNNIKVNPASVCAEYGCGVGRITHVLARRFRRVLAFDISQPHLDAARMRLGAQGIDNVEYTLVQDENNLKKLSGIDIFYSVIVLQHNPPPIMIDILNYAFSGLQPGGIAFFQIPTYSCDYSFSPTLYWSALAKQKTMEMHFLPQSIVLEVGRQHSVYPIELQPDWCVGHPGEWISNTFLMQKLP